MLRTIQSAVDSAASAASDGRVTSLQLDAAPKGHGDIAVRLRDLIHPKSGRVSMEDAGAAIIRSVAGLPFILSARPAGPFVNFSIDIDALVRAALYAVAKPEVNVGSPQRVMVEYLSPNTNKPLHLGHVRNGVIGSTVANLLEAVGHTVIRSELINDRGEHICKSMLGYLRHGAGLTPATAGKKGDHFVGDMYVAYSNDDKARRNALRAQALAEIERWSAGVPAVRDLVAVWTDGKEKDKARKDALKKLLKLVPSDEERTKRLLADMDAPDPELADMLKKWEDGDNEVRDLWTTMNGWVYEGFDVTKPRFGFNFSKRYFESDLYDLGKSEVEEGLRRGVFFKDDSQAVLFELPEKYGTNQDGKAHRRKVLNSNGTSVYLTQDIGTAILKAQEFDLDRSIYVVMDEQNPHFMSLFAILRALGYPWADKCHHLSYAMVRLPEGRMKSREGTVVDADDLADEMAALAQKTVLEREPTLDPAEAARRAEVIGMAAIKFYLARFAPTKEILFDPDAGISFDGDTGPYVLYTYARARSVLVTGRERGISPADMHSTFSRLGNEDERACLIEVMRFPDAVRIAAENYAPSILTDRLLALCGAFNRFYKLRKVVTEDVRLSEERLALVGAVAEAIRWGLSFLGIEPLEKM
jgi:arginyl-tRNA synthetase